MNLIIPLLTEQFQLTTYICLAHNTAAAAIFIINECKIIFLQFQLLTDYWLWQLAR